ncbi:MAG: hypothetical protein ACFE0Q_20725 [Anaerolineae bacterium]
MYKKIFVPLLIILLSIPLVLMAQDSNENPPEPTCTTEEFQDGLESLIGVIDEFSSQIESDFDAYNVLLAIETQIDNIRFGCGYEAITSETHPNGIVGPLSFSGRVYEVTFTAEDELGTVSTTTLNGDCGILGVNLLTDMGGGTETTLVTFGGDCVAFFEINGPDVWELTFTRLQ